MKNVSTKIAYMVIGSLLTMWATLTFIPGCGIHHSEPIKINVRNTKTNESQTSSKSILDELDKRLYKEGGMLYKKGDTLPPFDSDDIVKDGGEIHIVNRNNKVGGARIVGEFPPQCKLYPVYRRGHLDRTQQWNSLYV